MASFFAVGRPRAAWFTSLGLLGAGWVTAHVVSYVLVVPHAAERRELLAKSGHGYFRASDLLILCLTITVVGLVVCIVTGKRPVRAPSPWAFAGLPPIGFAIQEHVERMVAGGVFPAHLFAEPRFLLGLLLQLPFALAALVCARLLVTFAHGLARKLGDPARPKLVSVGFSWALIVSRRRARVSALALGRGERAPPLAAAR